MPLDSVCKAAKTQRNRRMKNIPELVCPAGNLPALKTAVDNGADVIFRII